MKRLILFILFVATLAQAAPTGGGGGVGDSGTSASPYTSTTPSNWARWDGKDSSTYNTISKALDSLAVGMSAVWGAWTGQWSYIVDLTNQVYYDCTGGVLTITCLTPTEQLNPMLNIQRGINTYFNDTTYLDNGRNYKMLVVGIYPYASGQIYRPAYLDPTTTCPLTPGNEYRRCVLFAPSTTYITQNGSTSDWQHGFPLGDANSTSRFRFINFTLHFENVFILIKESTLTTPVVMFQFGNTYGAGFKNLANDTYLSYTDDVAFGFPEFGVSSLRGKITGDLNLYGGGSTYPGYQAPWTADSSGGRPGGLPFNLNMSPKAWIGAFLSQAAYLDMDDFALRCSMPGASSSTSGDDVCMINQSSIFTPIGSIRSVGGTGLISYSSNQGGYRLIEARGGKIGIQIGDPYIGDDLATSWFCTNGFKTDFVNDGFSSGDIGQTITWTSGESGVITAVSPQVTVTGANFVTGDAGKSISWAGTSTGSGYITSRRNSTTINYSISSGSAMLSGTTITCSACSTTLTNAATSAYPNGNQITYRLTATNESTLESAMISSGETLSCTGCNGGIGITNNFSATIAAYCGQVARYSDYVNIERAPSIEGNAWGNLVAYGAYKSMIDGAWFESYGNSNDMAPSVLLGAGVCSTSHYEPCWNYCPSSGTCNILKTPSSPWALGTYDATNHSGQNTTFGDLEIRSGQCKGQKLYSSADDTDFSSWSSGIRRSQIAGMLALGPQFSWSGELDRTKAVITGCVQPTDINTSQNDSTVSCSDTSSVACRSFVANRLATGVVDLSGASWIKSAGNVLPGVWGTSIGTTPINYWYQNFLYPEEHRVCINVESLVDTDKLPLYTVNRSASIAVEASCRCIGTCTTLATLTFEDQETIPNTLTYSDCTKTNADGGSDGKACGYSNGTAALVCKANTGAAVWQPFNSGNTLTQGETLFAEVTNTPTTGDTYNICVRELTAW